MAPITENVSLQNLADFTKTLVPHVIEFKTILFYGDVGAGKTTLIKLLVDYLGSSNDISSPTFALVNTYESDYGEIYHYDLYRLKTEEEVLSIGILDTIDNENICLIEWPQLIEPYLDDYLKIEIEKINENERKFRIFIK